MFGPTWQKARGGDHFCPEGSQQKLMVTILGGHRLATLAVRDTLLVAWFSTWVMKVVMVDNDQDDSDSNFEAREIFASSTTNKKRF